MINSILKRNCILCGNNDSKKIFNFTYDFIKNIRKSDPSTKYGWDKETNNWIVKCKNCKCTYVDEVIRPKAEDIIQENLRSQIFEKEIKDFYNPDNLVNNLNDLNYNESILKNIYKNLKKKDSIKLLDYGSGNAEFSLFKKKYKIQKIVSYDPLYPKNIKDIFTKYKINSNPTNDLKEILNEKFDIIICQSVIEHVNDPNFEITNMRKMLSDNGIIYINNPYMNIEKDLKKLKTVKEIKKKDHISCYHIDHVNYMMPNIFINMCNKNNLKIINFWQTFTVTSSEETLIRLLKTNMNSFIHFALNSFKIFYKKQHFFLKIKK